MSRRVTKRRWLAPVVIICLWVGLLFFLADKEEIHAATKLSVPNIVLNVGDTYQLNMKSTTGAYTWKSNSPLVAAVARDAKKKYTATVTAKSEGVAVITAKKGKKVYRCMVVVMNPVSTEPDASDPGMSGADDKSGGESVTTTKAFKDITVFEKKGTVNVKRDKKKLSAAKDMKLKNKDYLTVAKKGFLRMCMDDDLFVYLEESSEAAVTKGWFNKIKIALTKGEMVVEVQKPLEDGETIDIRTPNTVMGIRGTIVAIKTTPQKDGSVKTINYVLEGTAELTLANNKKVTLKAGEGWETVTNSKGKVKTSKKTDASELSFKGIDVDKLKGADGEKPIVITGTGGGLGDDSTSDNGDGGSGGTDPGDTDSGSTSGTGETGSTGKTDGKTYSFAGAKQGDIIKFGSYEQDNKSKNGTEEIEWIVLSVEGDKALVMSRYAIACKPYNSSDTDVTWENCSLRSWLNSDFYNSAFDSDAQRIIVNTSLSNTANPEYDTFAGNSTKDRIFLLSADEMVNTAYGFSDDEEEHDISRRAGATEYAAAKGCVTYNSYKTEDNEPTTVWWLRTPGETGDSVVTVAEDGSLYYEGNSVFDENIGVRPAMYITLK